MPLNKRKKRGPEFNPLAIISDNAPGIGRGIIVIVGVIGVIGLGIVLFQSLSLYVVLAYSFAIGLIYDIPLWLMVSGIICIGLISGFITAVFSDTGCLGGIFAFPVYLIIMFAGLLGVIFGLPIIIWSLGTPDYGTIRALVVVGTWFAVVLINLQIIYEHTRFYFGW